MTTTKLIVAAALILATLTGCEAKSGAEISALGESLVSNEPAVESDAPAAPAQALIDYTPRAASTYAQAVNTCNTAGRQLCTIDQLADADRAGKVKYNPSLPAVPFYYWMQTVYISGIGNANTHMQTGTHAPWYSIGTAATQQFYCCIR